MAVEADFSSSYLQDPSESKSVPDVPSPDDLAWADSCLVKESEIADSSWDSLKDALMNIVYAEPNSQIFSATEHRDGLPEETNQTPPGLNTSVAKIISSGEEMEQESDFTNLFDDIGELVPETPLASPFRPNYSEDRKVIIAENDSALGFDGPVLVTEPSADDIFKVWDLETATDDEEEELVRQLNKVLAGGEPSPQTSSSTPALDLNPLDDLVAAISDLSLGKISS